MDAILQKKGGGGSDVHFISYTNTFQLFIKKKTNYMKQYVDSIPSIWLLFVIFWLI